MSNSERAQGQRVFESGSCVIDRRGDKNSRVRVAFSTRNKICNTDLRVCQGGSAVENQMDSTIGLHVSG
jgi:hypothetical protein